MTNNTPPRSICFEPWQACLSRMHKCLFLFATLVGGNLSAQPSFDFVDKENVIYVLQTETENLGDFDSAEKAEAAAWNHFDTDLIWQYRREGRVIVYGVATGYSYFNKNGINGFDRFDSSSNTAKTQEETIGKTQAKSIVSCQQSPLSSPAFITITPTGPPEPGSLLVPITYVRSRFQNDCGGTLGTLADDDFLHIKADFFTITEVDSAS